MQADLAEARAKIAALEEALSKANAELAAERQHHESIKISSRQLQSSMSATSRTVAQLESELAQAKGALADTEKARADLQQASRPDVADAYGVVAVLFVSGCPRGGALADKEGRAGGPAAGECHCAG